MDHAIQPLLAVIDVSDAGRTDPAFHDVLGVLTARAVHVAAEAGFVPRRVAAEQLGPDGLRAAVADADAVLLMGGEDVDPTTYGGDVDYESRGQHFRVADAAQIALVRELVADGRPTLGICRGLQVVNVALGGDLVQHLEQGGHVRPGAPERSMVDHDVAVEPGSRLASTLGATSLTVRSSHHQAVGRVAAGLRVVATAPDGTVEAVEHVSAPLWAVQWHPEDSGGSGTALVDLLGAMRERALAAPSRRRSA